MNNVEVGMESSHDNFVNESSFSNDFSMDHSSVENVNNDEVAKVLSEITEANPGELADYVQLLVSSKAPSSSETDLVREIGEALTQDDMVTASGTALEEAVGEAVRHILNRNPQKAITPHRQRENIDYRSENTDEPVVIEREMSRDYNGRCGNDFNHLKKKRIRGADKTFRYKQEGQQYAHGVKNPIGSIMSSSLKPPPPPPPPRPPPPPPRDKNYQHHQNYHRGVAVPPPPPIPPPPPLPSSYRQPQIRSRKNKNSQQHPIRKNRNVGLQHPPSNHFQHPPHPNMGSHHHPMQHGNHRRSSPSHAGENRDGVVGGNHPMPSHNLPPPPPFPSKHNTRNHQHYHQFSNTYGTSEKSLNQEQKRTLCLTSLPSHVSHGQLMNYFSRVMNVNVLALRLHPGDGSDSQRQDDNSPGSNKTALLELLDHHQAKFIYESPDPVLGNRFVGIKYHHCNLTDNTDINEMQYQHDNCFESSSNNDYAREQKKGHQKQLPQNDQSDTTFDGSYNESEQMRNSKNKHDDNKGHQESLLLSSYNKQDELLQKQEAILEKQINAHKKLLVLIRKAATTSSEKQLVPGTKGEVNSNVEEGGECNSTDVNFASTGEKPRTSENSSSIETQQQEKLKEILALQKKLNKVKQDRLEILTKTNKIKKEQKERMNCHPQVALEQNILVNDDNTTVGYTSEEFSHAHGRRHYSLDKRTTVLSVQGYPEDINKDELKSHFDSFGKVEQIEMLRNDPADVSDDGDIGVALVTFANRAGAEKAKENGSFFHDTALSLDWCRDDDLISSVPDKKKVNPNSDPEGSFAVMSKNESSEEKKIDAHEVEHVNDEDEEEEDDDDEEARWR